jgi:outer membrane protein assembly factor BamB
MSRLSIYCVPTLLLFLATCLLAVAEDAADSLPAGENASAGISRTDWPWWRGPERNGVAARDQQPPLRFSETENVLWKSPIPGRGHGTPIVVGEQVVLATADETRGVQSVLCYHRDNGELLWKTDVHQGGLMKDMNKKASHASSSLACDGERLFINFLSGGAVYTTALDRDGRRLWQTKISDYVVHQGYGSSPAVYGPLVIASADNKGGGAVAGLDRATGEVVWRNERPAKPNYASPIILRIAGRDQLLLTGCDLVSSFDPLTGETLWEIEGATTECVTSTVTDGARLFTSGGYPRNHVSAVAADGSGKIAWENTTRVYVPSILVRDGRLYAVTDSGVATCWDSASGKEVWQGRLGGAFTASPVLVGDRIYAINESGAAFVFRADPERFELLAESRLGDEVLATPVICGSRIYQRVAHDRDGARQEMLYCLGEGE